MMVSPDIDRAARWLAARPQGDFKPLITTLKSRFGLTDADAAEAILLAGYLSVTRRSAHEARP